MVKPAVYLTALAGSRFHLASPIRDEPIRVRGQDGPWRPKNYDGRFHGEVLLHDALVRSYNLSTVRLGLDVGLARVRQTIRALGVSRPVAAYPSMLLGAIELAPIEVNAMYQSLATGGLRQPLRAIRDITDRHGRSLGRYPERSTRAADPGAVFLVTHALRGVLTEGTGRRAREILGRNQTLAGKTGTTGGLRDSWFAGYGADRVAVVWVGRDGNQPRQPERVERGIGGMGPPDAHDRRRFRFRECSPGRGVALGESWRGAAHRTLLRRRETASLSGRAPPARGPVRAANRLGR